MSGSNVDFNDEKANKSPTILLCDIIEEKRLVYVEKRTKNNLAVRKCRSKQKDAYNSVRAHIFKLVR